MNTVLWIAVALSTIGFSLLFTSPSGPDWGAARSTFFLFCIIEVAAALVAVIGLIVKLLG